MKLCIPILQNHGRLSPVSPHFGRAPLHAVVDVAKGDLTILRKDDEGPTAHGHCLPVELLLDAGVGAVACKGIGRGAAARLATAGVTVFSTDAETLGEVVERFQSNKLQHLTRDNLCDGHHDHDHEHAHDHAH